MGGAWQWAGRWRCRRIKEPNGCNKVSAGIKLQPLAVFHEAAKRPVIPQPAGGAGVEVGRREKRGGAGGGGGQTRRLYRAHRTKPQRQRPGTAFQTHSADHRSGSSRRSSSGRNLSHPQTPPPRVCVNNDPPPSPTASVQVLMEGKRDKAGQKKIKNQCKDSLPPRHPSLSWVGGGEGEWPTPGGLNACIPSSH